MAALCVASSLLVFGWAMRARSHPLCHLYSGPRMLVHTFRGLESTSTQSPLSLEPSLQKLMGHSDACPVLVSLKTWATSFPKFTISFRTFPSLD
jgi:hypothetical protein